MRRFGLNLFGGGAVQTVGQEKRGFGFWHATMASGIPPAIAHRADTLSFAAKSRAALICGSPVPRTNTGNSKHVHNTRQFSRTGGWQTVGWIGTLQADRAHVRTLTISGWQMQNALPTHTMQMWRASLLRFNSAVDLALEFIRLKQLQMRADVSEISNYPKSKPADTCAGPGPRN